MSATAQTLDRAPWREDATVVGVVGFAHLVSHFFQLVLPPLFPWIREAFLLSYAELGFIMSVLFVISGVGQAIAGFVVDRYGALPTLLVGLLALAAGAIAAGLAQGYGGLLVAAVFMGIGNAVFHPVDFWLINHRVSVPRLGHAYSVHGLTGSLGWAFAPVFMITLAAPFGWRVAATAAAVLPLLAIVAAIFGLRRVAAASSAATDTVSEEAGSSNGALDFLRLPSVWMCFAFFTFVAAALGGVQGFAPTIFEHGYGLGIGLAAMSVTIYMLASGVGMLAGGWLVVKSSALERNITLALALAVVAAVLVGLGWLGSTVALMLMAVMGFGSGLSGPSRDMLIRRASPPGSTGRVYGVVYSGLDVGIAIGPVAIGHMIDAGWVTEVFHVVAACLFLGMLVAWRVAMSVEPDAAPVSRA